jgi:hypothetical protein
LWIAVFPLVLCLGCAVQSRQDEAARFVREHVAKVEPLATEANRVYWEAATTGRPEKFERLKHLQLQPAPDLQRSERLRPDQAFRMTRDASAIPGWPAGGQALSQPTFRTRSSRPCWSEIVELNTNVQETYNNYRPTIDGRRSR